MLNYLGIHKSWMKGAFISVKLIVVQFYFQKSTTTYRPFDAVVDVVNVDSDPRPVKLEAGCPIDYVRPVPLNFHLPPRSDKNEVHFIPAQIEKPKSNSPVDKNPAKLISNFSIDKLLSRDEDRSASSPDTNVCNPAINSNFPLFNPSQDLSSLNSRITLIPEHVHPLFFTPPFGQRRIPHTENFSLWSDGRRKMLELMDQRILEGGIPTPPGRFCDNDGEVQQQDVNMKRSASEEKEVGDEAKQTGSSTETDAQNGPRFEWLQCTRYRPPKLPSK